MTHAHPYAYDLPMNTYSIRYAATDSTWVVRAPSGELVGRYPTKHAAQRAADVDAELLDLTR